MGSSVTVVDSFIARFLVRLVPNPRDPEPDRDGKVRIVPIE
jgi:hypothetical protein